MADYARVSVASIVSQHYIQSCFAGLKTPAYEKKMEQKQIIINQYNSLQTPPDVLEYAEKYNGICGEASIAALLSMTMKEVFDKGEINRETFKGFTLQKEMRKILQNLGYNSIQKGVKDKHKLPDCNFGIIRVSFGKPEQHWSKTARDSHYICIKRFNEGIFVYDNAIDVFDDKPVNGVWIEKSEYYKIMDDQSMFITSYLEITAGVLSSNEEDIILAKTQS